MSGEAGSRKHAGYSPVPLQKKLGLKDGQVVVFLGLPSSLEWLREVRAFFSVECFADWKEFVCEPGSCDVVHCFTKSRAEFEDGLLIARSAIKEDGMIWVSWPKKASKVKTDITEDVIREICLTPAWDAPEGGLVDVKVCAVDEIWSGLKLMVRREARRN